MPLLRSTALACLGIAVLAAGCLRSRVEPWIIGRIQLVDSPELDNPALGLTRDELTGELRAAFQKADRFVLAQDGKKAGARSYSCKLELAFTRETSGEGGSGERLAVLGVLMELRRAGDPERLQSSGLGQVRLASTDPSVRRAAFRQALSKALAQAVQAQALQLGALAKTDAELIADLESQDPRVRDYAVRALAEHKNAAAVPALMARLGDSDREVAMRAVGALGAIGDPRAVPALIETTKNRDEEFVRSIVEVIGTIGGPDAQAWLFTIASGHADESVRAAAEEAQARLTERARASSSPEPTKVAPKPPTVTPAEAPKH